ncbi:hypothetical protein C8C85_3310 [Flavobacterium sp. 103]|uniref:hypothetical protein n=1 Tax=Flavobacterium sp. 103 TaxID=2135624 RepID=UPI000D5EE52F|nr:hypothetical protein [Flavobacterium sp. 103]PVX47373.1 hypothetical protein C8C85_3310 [Flavobacterium sp. 103]
MKISKRLIAGIVGAQLILCSCEAVRISETANYQDSKFAFGPDKTAVLVGNDNILLSEFTKTFNKKYNQKHDFVKQYDSLYTAKLKEEKIFGDIKYDKSLEFVSNDPLTFTQEQQKKVDSLFTNSKADYLIRIYDHEITNRIQGSPGMPMAMSNGGMGMSSGTQSESCIIKSHFQIYDIKSRKKVLDFVSNGNGSVVFFAFEQAFTDAMNSSIKNSTIYLKTGKLKF